MSIINNPEFSRNYGFWNEDEQLAIGMSRVAIAGVGGDGYQLGIKLARKGVSQFDIADPEVFEPENKNRVPGARDSTIGRLKAEVFAEEVRDIHHDADIRVFTDGVTPDNVEDFMSKADLVIDESELTYLHIGTSIAREARRRNIPNMMVMNVGFAAQVTAFDPTSKYTFERTMGIPPNAPIDEVKDMSVDFSRVLPYLPKYTDLRTLAAVQEGASLPSISEGVDIASGIGSAQAFLHLTRNVKNNRQEPVWAPNIAYIDSMNLKTGISHFPRISHYRHAIHAAIRCAMHVNPEASYTAADRERRARSLEVA